MIKTIQSVAIIIILMAINVQAEMTIRNVDLNDVTIPEDKIQIMFFGDSISACAGSDPADGWYPGVQSLMSEDIEFVGDKSCGETASYFNSAYGGRKADYILARVAENMKYFNTTKRRIAFILPSTNDIGSATGCNPMCEGECSDEQEEALADINMDILDAVQAIGPTVEVYMSTMLGRRDSSSSACNDDVLTNATGGEAGTNFNDYIQSKVEAHGNYDDNDHTTGVDTTFFVDLQNTAPIFDFVDEGGAGKGDMLHDTVHPTGGTLAEPTDGDGFANLVPKIVNAIE